MDAMELNIFLLSSFIILLLHFFLLYHLQYMSQMPLDDF